MDLPWPYAAGVNAGRPNARCRSRPHRSKNWHLNANLAALRATLIALWAQRAAHLS
jgi:hypothetical protein